MEIPRVHATQAGRGRDGGRWQFAWKVEPVSDQAMWLVWAEVIHPAFPDGHMEVNKKLPTDFWYHFAGQDSPGGVFSGAELHLGIIWRNEEWVLAAPVSVSFDQHGHPESAVGPSTVFSSPVDNQPVAPAGSAPVSWPLITPRQEKLLFDLVEWERAGETEFLLAETFAGASFINHDTTSVVRSDVEQLGAKGFLHLRFSSGGSRIASVTAEGHTYFEEKKKHRAPAEQLVLDQRVYVETDLARYYPDAARLITEAAELLRAVRRDQDVRQVGFKCREAIQEFALAFYTRFCPRESEQPPNRAQTRELVGRVLQHHKNALGITDTEFSDALFALWAKVGNLVQKVVHDSRKEEQPLTWDDGRRAVLYSYLTMAELHRLLATSSPA